MLDIGASVEDALALRGRVGLAVQDASVAAKPAKISRLERVVTTWVA